MASANTESLDVSCRATAHPIYAFLLNNRPASCLVNGLPYSLAHLQNVSASISWDHYLIFMRNCHNLLSEEEWIEQCTNYTQSPYLRSMLALTGLWLSPANCFSWGLGPRGNLVEAIYRCLKTTSLTVTRHECQVEYQLPKQYSLPPNYFWQSIACGFKGATATLGLSPISEVLWENVERGARFKIALPQRSLTRFIGSLFSSVLGRNTTRYNRINQKYLQDREHWLQQEISKRIESEQALRESEEQLRVLMEAAPEAIVVCDVDEDRIVSANHNAQVLFDISNATLMHTSIFDLVNLPSENSGRELQLLLEQVLSGRKAVFEFSYATPQGTEIPCEARLVRLPSNSKLLVRASITDISARKRAEQELVQARDAAIETARLLHLRDQELTIYADRLREAIRITNTGIFEHDHIAGTMYFSPELSQIFGLTPGVMDNPFDFLESVIEDDRQALLDQIQNVHSGVNDGQFQHIYRVRQPTGKIIWVEGRATTFFSGEGDDRTPVRTVGAVVDITERVAREEFLRENKRYLQAILESTNEIVFSLDMNLRYLAFNRHHFEKMKEVYGVEISLGSCISDYLKFGKDQQLFEESFLRALRGERFTVVQPYGDIAHSRSSFEVTFNPMRNEAGALAGVAVFARDTSEQIRAQNALRESEELQRLAIEVSELGIWKFNSRTRRFFLDARSQQLLGFSRSIVSEAELASHIHPDDLKNVLWKANGEPAEEGIFTVEHRVQTPEGKCRWVTVCATRLEKKSRAGEGAELEYIGTLLDVTERVETSNLLTSSLKEKDAMLKEIHHRVKNNLQVISSLLSLQAGEVQTEEVRLFSQESQRRVRAMALVHETLYQSETLARIDIAQYVKELCDNIIQSYGPERAIVVRTVDDLQLELDQALPLGLILSELIANAYKHAFPARTESGHIAVSLKRHSKSTLELSVVDDGVGLPVDLDPETHGSLGLKLVKLLTQQLRGQLTIANANGASFKIEIPYV